MTNLAGAYAALGESVTVDGSPVTAMWDGGYAQAFDVSGSACSLRCMSSDVSGVSIGDTVVRATVSYTVRAIQPIAPDELETRLILERA